MRLVVDNPHPEPEPVGSPVAVAVLVVAVVACLGSGALLLARSLSRDLPDWVVLAPLLTGVALSVVLVVLGAMDRRDAA